MPGALACYDLLRDATVTATATDGYFTSRFKPDPRREVLWSALWDMYFSKHIGIDDAVLELGAGYCHFINQVRSRRRIAVDRWEGVTRFAGDGVETRVCDVTDLGWLTDATLDFVFASNLFEHLTHAQFADVLRHLRRALKPTGRLCILQPNFRYCSSRYFDDFTHVTVYSHVSLTDFLEANGFAVVECRPRFLPLTVQSSLPVWPALIRFYLRLPFKPLGAQMLVVARAR